MREQRWRYILLENPNVNDKRVEKQREHALDTPTKYKIDLVRVMKQNIYILDEYEIHISV